MSLSSLKFLLFQDHHGRDDDGRRSVGTNFRGAEAHASGEKQGFVGKNQKLLNAEIAEKTRRGRREELSA